MKDPRPNLIKFLAADSRTSEYIAALLSPFSDQEIHIIPTP